ncbi:MAG TPA: replicative DNA helicase [Chitinophagales bacterium]|jgi:replicative DNA helicase|nr:replicative DNA helicase [Chitinophagales bacterium]HPH87476.1 replicative DNA helicase [Chitinophagales bacterium]HPN18104.1 replicative DNA helicase [Chitinophagales bacterium]
MEDQTTNKRTTRFTRNKTEDISNMLYGKIPPQARELEEAVLGAILIEKDAISYVSDILKPESFYVDAHATIFRSIQNLFGKSQPIDLLTVTEELRKIAKLEEVGGAFYLSELTNKIASSANVEYHARIIIQKFIQRELIRISNDIIRDSYEDTTDVFDLLDAAEKRIYEITDKNLRNSVQGIGQLVSKSILQIDGLLNRDDGLLEDSVPSGYLELDKMTSGWKATDLVIIAARPSMGKTAFVLNLARNAAVDFNMPVAIFSLEMGAVQLAKRLISLECEIDAQKVSNGKMSDTEYAILRDKVEKLSTSPIYINDQPAINIYELRAQCRRLQNAHGIKMVIIDYLQLMSGGGDKGMNREQEISSISRSLKGLAKELNIPVIALSQLNRSVETRGGDKKPQLSDLRESGSIEQDADMVMFLYRPEYYNLNEGQDGASLKGVSEIIIAKHRNGPTGSVELRFNKNFGRFYDAGGLAEEMQEFSNYKTLPSKGNFMKDEDGKSAENFDIF